MARPTSSEPATRRMLTYVAADVDATEGAIVSIGGGCPVTMFECPVDTGLAGVAAPTTLPHPGMPGSSITSSVIINTDPTEAVAVSLNEGSCDLHTYTCRAPPFPSRSRRRTPCDGTWRRRCRRLYDVGGFTDSVEGARRVLGERRREFYHSICQSRTDVLLNC